MRVVGIAGFGSVGVAAMRTPVIAPVTAIRAMLAFFVESDPSAPATWSRPTGASV